MAVLQTLIEARPDGLGIILPHGFLRQQQYTDLRQLLADQYDSIELTALPQRVFQHASFESAIVVASGLRDLTRAEGLQTSLRSIDVASRNREDFLASGRTTAERRRTKPVRSGDLWIGALDEVWEYLADYPALGSKAAVNRGLQWVSQSAGWSAVPRHGFRPGILRPADSLLQFGLITTGYVDMHEEAAYRLGPLTRPWDKPKILANVSPRSRGPWRLDGVTDLSGLVPSQAFFGIWPNSRDLPLEVIEAQINISPT